MRDRQHVRNSCTAIANAPLTRLETPLKLLADYVTKGEIAGAVEMDIGRLSAGHLKKVGTTGAQQRKTSEVINSTLFDGPIPQETGSASAPECAFPSICWHIHRDYN